MYQRHQRGLCPDRDASRVGRPSRARAAAKKLGDKLYFTRIPCKHGHVCGRFTYSGKCVECSKIWCKQDYWENPERARTRVSAYFKKPDIKKRRKEYSKTHYEEKAEYYRQKSREYHAVHRAQRSEDRKRKRLASLDEIRERDRLRYRENLEAARRYNRQHHSKKYHSDLNFKLRHVLKSRLQNSLSFIVNGKRKVKPKIGSFVRDLGCPIQSLKEYIESKFDTTMSWGNWGTRWQLDHIRPLASFNLTDRAQFLLAAHYTNLQPLTIEEHRLKSASERRSLEHAAGA